MNRLFVIAAMLAVSVPAAAQKGPAPAVTKLPAEVIGLACSPTLATSAPQSPLRVTGGQDSFTRRNYALGDLVTINAGSKNGIEIGQQYFIRRIQTVGNQSPTATRPGTARTAGWLKVYAVDDEMSLATVEHVCDSIEVGDYLEPFTLPQVPVFAKEKPKAERDNYAHVMKGDDRKHTFGKGDYFVIDRGSSKGVVAGAQFVVYRDKHESKNFLFELGEAVAVDVKPESATLLVTLSRDGFAEGDYVAQRKVVETK